MSHDDTTPLARLHPDRRTRDRRRAAGEAVLSMFEAFLGDERRTWRQMDRRIAIRRARDVRRRIARL